MKYGRATCLPHKGRGVPLSALPKDTTSKLAGLFSTLSLFMLSTKQGSCEYHFLKSFGMTRLRNEPHVYRLQCGRSNHYTIAPVVGHIFILSQKNILRLRLKQTSWTHRCFRRNRKMFFPRQNKNKLYVIGYQLPPEFQGDLDVISSALVQKRLLE